MSSNPKRSNRPPALPKLLDRKIYKTGQTRGADDDQIFQNRVNRNSTSLIPFPIWKNYPNCQTTTYENGYIVLISPTDYFCTYNQDISEFNLVLGKNALIFYELRDDWNQYPPSNFGFNPGNSRTPPLGGEYVARIANTTSSTDKRINLGFTGSTKGAGIRQYEYASSQTILECRMQLEAVFWLCVDSDESLLNAGMSQQNIELRKGHCLRIAEENSLLDYGKLQAARIVNANNESICPLCAEKLSAFGFMSRLSQAEGREIHDLTVTEVNLFHIEELTFKKLNHRPYNLGWGHHHCNVVCKDSGIDETLNWMKEVLNRNGML